MWWEGGYDGYALAVAVEPAEALGGLAGAEAAAARVCPVNAARVAPPRRDSYPLARLAPGGSSSAATRRARSSRRPSAQRPATSAHRA